MSDFIQKATDAKYWFDREIDLSRLNIESSKSDRIKELLSIYDEMLGKLSAQEDRSYAELVNRVSELEFQNSDLSDDVDRLESDLYTAERERGDLEDEVSDLKDQISSLELQLKENPNY